MPQKMTFQSKPVSESSASIAHAMAKSFGSSRKPTAAQQRYFCQANTKTKRARKRANASSPKAPTLNRLGRKSMLRQESITAVSQPPTSPATPDCDLLPGTETLIEEIRQRLLAGQSVNNRTLTEIADRAYSVSRARGAYTAEGTYDATETAVKKLLETKAGDFLASKSIETYD